VRHRSACAKLASALAVAATLAACDPPSWRNPETARGTSAPPPEVQAVVAADLAARKPSAHADHLTAEPLPPPPAWAVGLIGKPLRLVYPALGQCLGNTDSVKLRYGRGVGGARLAGWSWDPQAKAPAPRIVLVDPEYRIRGAGESGTRRRDVPRVVPSVTTDHAGWEAITPLNAGSLDAYGVLADGKTVCTLGHLEL
jgi:hypothetical protein